MSPRSALPRSWIDFLTLTGDVGIGLDLATTTKKLSNPSSLTVAQKDGGRIVQRLVLRWKTDREAVTRAIVALVLEDIRARGARLRRLCVDATNERFFAQRLRAEFSRFCPVDLIVSSENTTAPDGTVMNFKQYLGSLYVNQFEAALMAMPAAEWLRSDHRLVVRDRGSFDNALDENGNHGDTFDSGKLAVLALTKGGRAEATALPVGAPLGRRRGNPLERLARKFFSRLN